MKKMKIILVAVGLLLVLLPITYSQVFIDNPVRMPVQDVFCIKEFEGKTYLCSDPILKFNHPKDNTFVSGVAILDAGINNDRFDPSTISYLAFEYFDGRNWEVIEDLTGNKFIRNWDTQWDIGFLPSGPLPVRIVLRNPRRAEWSATLTLKVNQAPVSNFTVHNGRGVMVLNGLKSFDPDGQIESYNWLIDTDEPFRVKGEIVEVPLERIPLDEQFGLTLTTTDDHGAETPTHTLLTLPCRRCNFTQEEKSCGCMKMDVVNTGLTKEGIEMYWMPMSKKRDLGAYDDINMSKSGPFQIVHNFQVIANLVPKSDQEKCFEGQRIKKSSVLAGDTFPKIYFESIIGDDNSFRQGPPISCPFGGDKWCDDHYHKASDHNGLKKYVDQNRIIWTDGPGNDGVFKTLIGSYQILANFEARVSGPRGSCQCNWDLNISIGPDGTVLSNRIFNKVCNP